jgi:hypothetical protein
MRPKKPETTGSGDLFRARLDQIINLKHELAQLAGQIDWDFIDGEIAPLYSDKRAAMVAGRYAHAKQFNRHRRELRILRTRLGRLIRDRPQDRRPRGLEAAFALPLTRASQIRSQQQRQRGWKLYSFHAPETECIGKGKASAPYEFGVKVSIVTTNEGHLGRCYLKGRAGDAANAILSAVGHNFRRILAWLRDLLRPFLIAILRLLIYRSALIPAS